MPAQREKASQSDAKHVRQERMNRRSGIAGRSHSARLWPDDRRHLPGNTGRRREPVGGLARQPDSFCGHGDQFVAIEIQGIVIMTGSSPMNRGSGREMIAHLHRMAVVMASANAMASVVMPMVMAVVVTMPGEMDMRPTGMHRGVGMHLVRVRDRNSAENRLGGHEH